jgi:hypothetical protein
MEKSNGSEIESKKLAAAAALILAIGSAGVAAADTPEKDTTFGSDEKAVLPDDPGVIDIDRTGDLDSGLAPWGLYKVSAKSPVNGLVRIGAHHATRWSSDPKNPYINFDISTHEVEWDIAEMGLEIKADHVPGYYIRATVCARLSGNIGGADGADGSLTISGASTHPETSFLEFEPSAGGSCHAVNVYFPAEAGAEEYTLMVRPALQIIQQTYWQYTIYGDVTVQYYPIL